MDITAKNCKVLKCIKFTMVPEDIITDEVLNIKSLTKDKELLKIISDALHFHSAPLSQPLLNNTVRGVSTVAFVEEGKQKDTCKGFASGSPFTLYTIQKDHFTNSRSSQILKSTSGTKYALESLTMCAVGHFLFIFGTDSTTFKLTGERFDCANRSWMTCSSSNITWYSRESCLTSWRLYCTGLEECSLIKTCLSNLYSSKVSEQNSELLCSQG